ncbi:MAG: glycoside hydrolase family 32 protein [Bacteroidota bacterium]|nr:glycoside hydrolase family 32 protein [Bacteroidota bacterium]
MRKLSLFLILFILASAGMGQVVKEFEINKQYLNFPIDMQKNRQMVQFVLEKDTLTYNVIRIADTEPDYWVFKDVSAYKGKILKLIFAENSYGLDKIYQSDEFAGQDSLYKEKRRPQFHFSSRRGWNNDPNGLVYFDGEYHLFYQHNPYEIHWQNMTWGHAVSPDLVHWTELNDALYPDRLGTMFSGSAVIDKNNTAGWGKNALVAAYTAAGKKQTQCIAYSTDKGRTFTKYEGNPVVGPTRDPKVIWYEPNQEWVMALYEVAGISFFTSKNLKDWKKESHIDGFYECPELFELPIDGDPGNTLWVAYGGSGAYLLGDFNGKTFTPKYGKYRYTHGNHYAAQTYNNTPDGKRIQIGWGTIPTEDMPFSQMMCFPTELTLRTTNEGVRIFSEPIDAIETLHTRSHDFSGLTISQVNEKMKDIHHDLLHVVIQAESLNGQGISIDYNGNKYVSIDADEINGIQTPQLNPGKLVFDIEMLIDRTSVESFINKGQIVFVKPLVEAKTKTGLEIHGHSSEVKIHTMKVHELKSAW